MGLKSYKEVISLVCCSDATFTEFEHFVVAWQRGDIPNVYGALGKPQGERDVGEVLRDFSQLSVNRFRPVNGLPDEDLKLVWTQLAQGSVWVSRPAKYQGPEDIAALKEYCKALKGKDKLGKSIVRYWMTRYQEDFNTWGQLADSYTIPEPWLGEMLKYLPEKPEKEVVTEDVLSSDGDDEDSSKKKKKPKKKSTSVDVLPSQIKRQLHKFHCAKHGVEIPQRLQPLEVLHIKDITQYQLTLDEKHDCKLVFFGSYSSRSCKLGEAGVQLLLGHSQRLTSSEGFVIVAVMDFRKPLVSFSAALKEMKDARVLMECGCYEGPRLQRKIEIPSPCWQLVYAYVSFGPEDYKPSLYHQPALHPTSSEYETKKGLEDMVPEKGEGAVALNVKNKVPRWEFVNLSSPDGKPLTHPICKRGRFCYRMVINFSKAESTVLDFFSGGIFAREALLCGRDVIYFANSEEESIFLKEYGKALERYNDHVRSWYKRYKSLKVPTSSSPQLALASSSQQLGLASTSQQPRGARRPRLQLAVGVVAEEFNQEESNDNQDLDPTLCTPCMGSRMQDSNDQGSLVEAVKQVNTGEHEEEGPFALVLHHSRSVGSSHFEENPSVPLLPEQSMEAAVPVPPCETLDINENNPVLEDQIPDLPVLATDHEDVGISSVQQDVQAGINASGDNEPNTDNRPKKKVKRKKIQ
ncbi:hypothetical protein R1sor_004396 [Riccia sorocarpa]|uniref:Uncharacterized protein n=1 Tax=Riccia sorocarpa TaxID=122646 RepID=A0ABD3HKC2_9MARC